MIENKNMKVKKYVTKQAYIIYRSDKPIAKVFGKAEVTLLSHSEDLLDSLTECLNRLDAVTPGIALDEKDTARALINKIARESQA